MESKLDPKVVQLFLETFKELRRLPTSQELQDLFQVYPDTLLLGSTFHQTVCWYITDCRKR